MAALNEANIDIDFERQWTIDRAIAIPAFYASSIAAATSNDRMQPAHISQAGLKKAVQGIKAHDSFNVLQALLDGRKV